MSVTIAAVVPVEPTRLPEPARVAVAQAWMRRRLEGIEIDVRETLEVELIDVGELHRGVRCPGCAAELGAWWAEATSRCHEESRLADRRVVTPCCGHANALEDLVYPGGERFARFAFRVRGAIPDAAVVAELERILGCALRVVVARY